MIGLIGLCVYFNRRRRSTVMTGVPPMTAVTTNGVPQGYYQTAPQPQPLYSGNSIPAGVPMQPVYAPNSMNTNGSRMGLGNAGNLALGVGAGVAGGMLLGSALENSFHHHHHHDYGYGGGGYYGGGEIIRETDIITYDDFGGVTETDIVQVDYFWLYLMSFMVYLYHNAIYLHCYI